MGEEFATVQACQAGTLPSTWAQRISTAVTNNRIIDGHTFLRRRSSASQPVDIKCADGNIYVVKALRNDVSQGRMMFNDHVIARLGSLIEAPVAEVALINIPQSLIDINADRGSQMGHISACVAHGSKLFPNVSDRVDGFAHVGDGDNKLRFATIGVLHSWACCSDRQFIYQTEAPYRVYSVDHGHFFPGGPNWTQATLRNAAPVAVAHDLITACGLTSFELAGVGARLNQVSEDDLATILASPPNEWDVPIDDRAALAALLWTRRCELISTYP